MVAVVMGRGGGEERGNVWSGGGVGDETRQEGRKTEYMVGNWGFRYVLTSMAEIYLRIS